MSSTGHSGIESSLLRDIDRRAEELYDVLATLIRFRTPNPPGNNEQAAQHWVAGYLRDLGLEVDVWDVLPGRPNVVGRYRGQAQGPVIALNGHIDVCEDRLLDRWSTDAYDPVIEDGFMFGRGASDMKSALASFMFALTILKSHGIEPAGDILLQSVIGEEAAEPGTRSAIERGYAGDLAIVGESSKSRALVACVGVLTLQIDVASPETLHLSARRAMIHAGGGLDGANCVDKVAQCVLPALAELEREWAVFKTHPRIPAGACSINVFRIDGGSTPFTMPDRCRVFATITYLPDERRGEVIKAVEERLAAASRMDGWLTKHPPVAQWHPPEYPIEFAPADYDPATPELQSLIRAIRDVTGEAPELGGRSGITDAGWFSAAGVPAVVFGPGDMTQAHAVDESVSLKAVVEHCKIMTTMLARTATSSPDASQVGVPTLL